jgi:thymidylate synthase ThyX
MVDTERSDDQDLQFTSNMSVDLITQESPKDSSLMRDRDGSPFEHSPMTFRIWAPIFVLQDLRRYQSGWSYTEVSARGREPAPVFYIPVPRRSLVPRGYEFTDIQALARLTSDAMRTAYQHSYAVYQDMLSNGVAPEFAP